MDFPIHIDTKNFVCFDFLRPSQQFFSHVGMGLRLLLLWIIFVIYVSCLSLFCLFYLILYVPSTIFQLNRDRSSWVEPVLSWDKFLSVMLSCLVVTRWERAGWPLGSLVGDVFLCFCHFPVWCPGSGVVLSNNCIDSWSMPASSSILWPITISSG